MLLAQLRLVRIACVAHLRNTGSMPWLLLLIWIGWAALLEPSVLRRSGMCLVEPAAQFGGFLLLVAMVGDPGIRLPTCWHRWLTVLTLTWLVAFVQSSLVVGILLLSSSADGGSMAIPACMFAACSLAPALHVSVAGFGRAAIPVLVMQVSVSANLAVSVVRGSAGVGDWVAAGLCLFAALLTTPRPVQVRYANRYSW